MIDCKTCERNAQNSIEVDSCNECEKNNLGTMKLDKYKDLKAIPGEEVYSDYDEDNYFYGVFGVDSGFCYSTWADEEQAEHAAQKMKEERYRNLDTMKDKDLKAIPGEMDFTFNIAEEYFSPDGKYEYKKEDAFWEDEYSREVIVFKDRVFIALDITKNDKRDLLFKLAVEHVLYEYSIYEIIDYPEEVFEEMKRTVSLIL